MQEVTNKVFHKKCALWRRKIWRSDTVFNGIGAEYPGAVIFFLLTFNYSSFPNK